MTCLYQQSLKNLHYFLHCLKLVYRAGETAQWVIAAVPEDQSSAPTYLPWWEAHNNLLTDFWKSGILFGSLLVPTDMRHIHGHIPVNKNKNKS